MSTKIPQPPTPQTIKEIEQSASDTIRKMQEMLEELRKTTAPKKG